MELRAGERVGAGVVRHDQRARRALEFERSVGADDDVAAARRRGEAYLLERRLLHRLSDDVIPQDRWLQLGFPYSWNYDVLRALDHVRATGQEPDARLAEALGILEATRDTDGRWPLEVAYQDDPVDLGEAVGGPSRWITHRALRVLRWAHVPTMA